MSWYYIDGAGTTLGPVADSELEKHWKNGTITGQTYVWNGSSVNEWSLIEAVSFLHNKLKNANKPAPPRGGPAPPRGGTQRGGGASARPKKKAGGGARVNLLDSIRSGKSLKKVEKKDLPAAAGGSKGASAGGGMKPKGGGKMSLQDQLKMKLGNRKGGGPKKKVGGGPIGGANKFGAKSPGTGGFGAKKATGGFGAKKATGGVGAAKSKFGGAKKSSGGSGEKMSKFEIKKAIDQCNDDWILKAISKLLS